jgi:hypothetical protein
LNHVAFIWDAEAADGMGAVRVEVDGRALADLIREVESPYAEAEGHPEIAGAYVGLRPWPLHGSLPEHFMGAAGSDLACGPPDKTVLLGCECSEPGCWPLMAQLAVEDHEVVWRAFEQPHRSGRWAHDNVGELRFDRSQYMAALAAAEELVPRRP